MKIIFVAKMGNHDNCDEEALAFAFRKLGHDVHQIDVSNAKARLLNADLEADFLFFLKWDDWETMSQIKVPKVFWYWDMVRSISGDPTLAARSSVREKWLANALSLSKVGFLSDGDAVDRDETGKLRWLMQGADERVVGPGVAPTPNDRPPILFMGMANHGRDRLEHIRHLQEMWGNRFEVLGNGGPHRRIHGRALADYMAGRIVVAPNGPQTDRYWSNRLFLALGFGGFLLHPCCDGLEEFYFCGREYMDYLTNDHCDALIHHYLTAPEERTEIAAAGYKRTLEGNLYSHRCERLVEMVREVLRQ